MKEIKNWFRYLYLTGPVTVLLVTSSQLVRADVRLPSPEESRQMSWCQNTNFQWVQQLGKTIVAPLFVGIEDDLYESITDGKPLNLDKEEQKKQRALSESYITGTYFIKRQTSGKNQILCEKWKVSKSLKMDLHTPEFVYGCYLVTAYDGSVVPKFDEILGIRKFDPIMGTLMFPTSLGKEVEQDKQAGKKGKFIKFPLSTVTQRGQSWSWQEKILYNLFEGPELNSKDGKAKIKVFENKDHSTRVICRRSKPDPADIKIANEKASHRCPADLIQLDTQCSIFSLKEEPKNGEHLPPYDPVKEE